ncbi:hypothetical protein RJ639_011606 [Escallonia herrerae]|uniref:Uncharacterized protein n=1 Tax=Escallonia herrerae TaxID=1293975 RepID=A0AA89APA5_9ASTE|nr:hypothetical protein RJ639_011606 [Escallonia herrerae]
MNLDVTIILPFLICWSYWSQLAGTLLESAGHLVTTLDLGASGINPTQLGRKITSSSSNMQPLMEFMASLPPGERVILVGSGIGQDVGETRWTVRRGLRKGKSANMRKLWIFKLSFNFIVCEEDEVLNEGFQRWMIINSPPKEVKPIAGGDYMVMLSKPKELCLSLQEIADEYE